MIACQELGMTKTSLVGDDEEGCGEGDRNK